MLKNQLKKYIQKIFPKTFLLSLKNFFSFFIDIYSLKSYSQEGEDMILHRIFDNVDDGFYVDIGAHHPKRFSNTYLFYKRGWRGINIDATPGSMKLFNKIRPRDINIEAAIAKDEKEIIFFMFNDPALNTLDEEFARSRNNKVYKIVKEIKIKTNSLTKILSKKMPKEKQIDFISIDTERLDLEVLESNDWEKFRPKCIAIEDENKDFSNIENSKTYNYLVEKKYKLIAKTFNTLIFQDIFFDRASNK